MRRVGKSAWLIASVALAGCSDNQSVLNPKSGPAAELAQLSWLLFGMGAFVLAVVSIALLVALRGSESARAIVASPRAVVWGGIGFPIVVLTALLIYGVWLTAGSQLRLNETADLRIRIVGEQWWWRIAYEGPDGNAITSANELRIPVGRATQLELTAADVIHSFWVPNLAGKIDMIPGRITRLRLEPNTAGVYRGQCAEYCGGPHALMAFEVVAMEAKAFDEWLSGQAAPARQAETPATTRGQELFLALGCGGCHTVRGTEAAGTIGPDLSHLASRRSVGIDANALSAASIAAFIRDGQHIKPGNLMPPYRLLDTEELVAVSAYLAALE